MIRFDIISAVPALLSGPLDHSIVKRAKDKSLVDVHIHDLRNFTSDKHLKIDESIFIEDEVEEIAKRVTRLS